MSFIEAIKAGFKNYFDFTGVASRSEFWWFFLFAFMVRLVAGFSDSETISNIVFLALFIPTLSAMVRRLRDADVSVYNILWVFLPIVGQLILIYKLAQPTGRSGFETSWR